MRRDYKNQLEYDKEHQLNTDPLKTDMLIIKKNPNVFIDKTIARIFKTYNIVEYKGPGDHLDIDTFHKLIAYAALFKSLGEAVDAIPGTEITASIFRYEKPEKLFSDLEKLGATVEEKYPAVYYVTEFVYFPVQIVVIGEPQFKDYPFLKVLNRHVSLGDFKEILKQELLHQGDRKNAGVIIDRVLEGNPDLVKAIKEDENMSKELQEILQPAIDQKTLELLKNLMKNMKLTAQQAMDGLGLSER